MGECQYPQRSPAGRSAGRSPTRRRLDAMTAPITVGFDLDLTLVDSRPGIAATYRALTERTGVYIDAEAASHRLRPPLDVELARWFPPDEIEIAGELYRQLYPHTAVETSPALPGVAPALAA